MKRIEFVLCLFFISTVSFAQKEIAPTKNLDAYIGTWMYQSNDTIFKIVLKKGYAEDQHMIINGLMGGYFGSPDKPGGLSIQLCKSEKKEFYIRYSS